MTQSKLKNVTSSVRQRLLNISRERKEDHQLILIHYGLERLLYRLSLSEHKDSFILKGAILFFAWEQKRHRATRDIDFLGKGNFSLEKLKHVFKDLCRQEVKDDGLIFDPKSIEVYSIKEDQDYGGIRINLKAHLESAKIPIQVENSGDTIFNIKNLVSCPRNSPESWGF